MAADVAISVESVSKRFKLAEDRASSIKELMVSRRRRNAESGFWAVKDVSLEIPRGTTFGLVGHNGSGKSTLLRLMAGIHQPSAGRIEARGRISSLLELGSGFHPDLTGRENIYLNGAMLGLNKKHMRSIVDEIVDFSGLHEFIDQPVKVYSSGMYVRLGFAVAVHVEPEILLVDEVMAVGDEEFQRRCFDHMYKLRRDGATVVFVSHSLSMVESMCENAAWLDHGSLMEVGPAVEVCQSYLTQVNDAEAERISAEQAELDAGREVELTGEHRGSGEIRVYHVDILDPQWNRIPHARTGEPLRIRLWYDAAVPIDNPRFSFDLFQEEGVHVAGATTQGQIETGKIEAGQGFIDFAVPKWPVNPGSYFVGVAVTDGEGLHTFDHVDRIIAVKVAAGGSSDRGLVRIEGAFEPPVAHQVS